MDDKKLLANLKRKVKRSRNFPANTCPASRHLQMIAEGMVTKRGYPMLQEEPEHCAITMLAVVNALYKTRTELARLKAARQGRKP